jgi:hypothetical protein
VGNVFRAIQNTAGKNAADQQKQTRGQPPVS